MTTRLLNPQPMPYLAVSLGALLGVACASQTADLGHDQDAASAAYPSPIYATTPPPTATDGGTPMATGTPWKLVERTVIASFGVDRGLVFWVSVSYEPVTGGAKLNRCEVTDCAGTHQSWPVVPDGQVGGVSSASDTASIAFDTELVYWPTWAAGGSVIYSCPRNDCTSPVAANLTAPATSFALDGPDLFLLTAGALLRCAPGDCDATLARVPVQGPSGVAPFMGGFRLVADGDYLYVASIDRILRLRKDGSSAFEVLVDGKLAIDALALSGDSVFWTEGEQPGAVYTCLKTGCAGEPRVVVGVGYPRSLATDAERVYVTDSSPSQQGRLSACALGGCAEPTVLVEGAGIDGTVLVDDRFVYVAGNDPNPATWSTPEPTPGFIAVVPK